MCFCLLHPSYTPLSQHSPCLRLRLRLQSSPCPHLSLPFWRQNRLCRRLSLQQLHKPISLVLAARQSPCACFRGVCLSSWNSVVWGKLRVFFSLLLVLLLPSQIPSACVLEMELPWVWMLARATTMKTRARPSRTLQKCILCVRAVSKEASSLFVSGVCWPISSVYDAHMCA